MRAVRSRTGGLDAPEGRGGRRSSSARVERRRDVVGSGVARHGEIPVRHRSGTESHKTPKARRLDGSTMRVRRGSDGRDAPSGIRTRATALKGL
jgi:hypothetical protein